MQPGAENVGNGAVALVLHAHLPYVRSAERGSLEEDWFFQALLESYLPLLEVLEKAADDPSQRPRVTLGLSPTLLSLLSDLELKQRFRNWVMIRQHLLNKVKASQRNPAEHLAETIGRHLQSWVECEGDLISRFAQLRDRGVLDLITCAATHGYLPLLRAHPEAIRGQLRTAVREHHRLLGQRPLGIWLPECAYYEGLDRWMLDAGLRYAVLDGHGLLHASPRPRYGVYAPICSHQGVAFFGRDSDATLPVWSARDGYPGHPDYREFHRDLGWDLPLEKLSELGLDSPRPLGIKLHRVSSPETSLEEKSIYDPDLASARTKEHAQHYLSGRRAQLQGLRQSMDIPPMLVAPFDAELFGHWWFEGPNFIAELFSQAKSEQVSFIRLIDVLNSKPALQLCAPSPSSWGKGGYHDYWLNESNAWVVSEWNRAGQAMVERCSRGLAKESHLRLLRQAARELLLAQSSDWSFIIRAGTTTELAKERIHHHLERFWKLMAAINGTAPRLSEAWLTETEFEDRLFPLIQPADWAQKFS